MDDLLTAEERAIRDRVRAFADQELIPVANEYWERAEFPARLLKPYAALGVAGGAIKGYGCPGMSPVAEGLVALELARGDGSLAQLQAEGRARLDHAALAKLSTASGARRVCAMAHDLLGGNGILLGHHVARHHADVEAVYTYEGTDTVRSLIVGRAITGHSAFA